MRDCDRERHLGGAPAVKRPLLLTTSPESEVGAKLVTELGLCPKFLMDFRARIRIMTVHLLVSPGQHVTGTAVSAFHEIFMSGSIPSAHSLRLL